MATPVQSRRFGFLIDDDEEASVFSEKVISRSQLARSGKPIVHILYRS